MILKIVLISICFLVSGCSIFRTPNPREINEYTFTKHPNANDFENKSIIHQYAPIIFQSTLNESKTDFIADFDYDLDGKTETNRDNKDKKLKATVYYSIVETSTHFFITYLFYHIEDGWSVGPGWGNWLVKGATYWFGGQHENDGESVQIVVDKKTDGTAKDIIIMAWQHHNSTDFLINKKLKAGGFNENEDEITHLENTTASGSPIFYLEPGKHAIHSSKDEFHWMVFNDDDYRTVKFKPKPMLRTGNLPKHGDEWHQNNVSREYRYGFKSIKKHLWCIYRKNQEIGDEGIMDGAFDVVLEKGLKKVKYKNLPRFFNSDEWSAPFKYDAGIMPFYFGGGELFFDPAHYYKKKFHLYEEPYFGNLKWSTDYIYNPYLPDYLHSID
jgi:hypothetical protein